MGDFYTPGRRKIGMVSLVMTCVFAAGWVRSQTVQEVFAIPLQDSEEIFLSSNHNLSWLRHSVPPGGQRLLLSRKAVFPQWHVLALQINDYVDSSGGGVGGALDEEKCSSGLCQRERCG